jgi:hypothetical protein
MVDPSSQALPVSTTSTTHIWIWTHVKVICTDYKNTLSTLMLNMIMNVMILYVQMKVDIWKNATNKNHWVSNAPILLLMNPTKANKQWSFVHQFTTLRAYLLLFFAGNLHCCSTFFGGLTCVWNNVRLEKRAFTWISINWLITIVAGIASRYITNSHAEVSVASELVNSRSSSTTQSKTWSNFLVMGIREIEYQVDRIPVGKGIPGKSSTDRILGKTYAGRVIIYRVD